MYKINLGEAFGRFSDHWSPKIAGELNDSFVKLAKFSGQFHWHHHEHEDELFLVVRGRLPMGLRTGDIDLDAGEFIIRSEEHTSELQSLIRISYAVFCLKKKQQHDERQNKQTESISVKTTSKNRYHNIIKKRPN